jgi:predicted DCC family thiol-disulfide oxidoreductase YuxK
MTALILFDGVCNFCSGAVNFVIARDPEGYFRFAPLQSGIGKEMRDKFGIDELETDSILLIEDDRAYTYSTAALRIAKRLSGLWSWFYAFILVPKPVRDFFYKLFARYRYTLFGRQETCMLPTPDVRARFLT